MKFLTKIIAWKITKIRGDTPRICFSRRDRPRVYDLINDFQSAYLSDQRFTWRGTIHDGNINRGETGSGPKQQSPSHLLLDFLRALCVLLQVCLPELWLPLLAGYYYTRWNTYRDPRDQSCTRRPRTKLWNLWKLGVA